MYVQSTDFYRTIQSAYAQLFGHLHSDIVSQLTQSNATDSRSNLLLLNKNEIISLNQQDNQLKAEVILPFKVRGRDRINKQLLS